MTAMRWKRTVLAGLRTPQPFGQLRLRRDVHRVIRVNFLGIGAHLGLFASLRQEPGTAGALAKRFGIDRLEAFATLLEVGVAVGELGRRDGVYRLRGRRARMLAEAGTDGAAALLDEVVTYHGDVYSGLPEFLRGGPAGDYLRTAGSLVARSSRILEPFTAAFVREKVHGLDAPRVLDAGCGSGTYLVAVAEAAPGATGLGVDVQPDAVEMTRRNLTRAAAADRFAVRCADVRTDPPPGPFDVILLLNNVYYFSVPDRLKLFRSFADSLGAGGRLVMTSMCLGNTPNAASFSLVLHATQGCYPLPRLPELAAELRECGFTRVTSDRLTPFEPYFGLTATP